MQLFLLILNYMEQYLKTDLHSVDGNAVALCVMFAGLHHMKQEEMNATTGIPRIAGNVYAM